jgi:ABC-2 type transport system ATP-binding protein
MPATERSVVEVIQLTKVFRDFWGRESVKALDSLSFDIERGEVFGLLGPNGSGKTTTVRLILGLLFPSAGAVRLFGRSPGNVEVKKRVGYMPEESHLYSYLNAEETLDFFGRTFRLNSAERRRRTDALIDMVGLTRARRRPIGQYSKGMARRIGLAQSLINDPDFLILDEPTTGLDPIGTREMKDLILQLRDRGKTILICSHLLADVEEICDRICILYGGRSRAIGQVSELLAADDISQIRMPKLDEEQMSHIVAAIREAAGSEKGIEVSQPTRRLEDYFLNVVEEARRERLATAGAERGTSAAAFLMGEEEPEGEHLLEELVQAGREEPEEHAAGRVSEPAPVIRTQHDDSLIDDLLQAGSAETAQAAPPERDVAASEIGETGVRRDVLDQLLTDGPITEDKDGRQAD